MTLLKASDAPVGINKGKPILASGSSVSWSRPSDWLTFNAPGAAEQKVIGNIAIFDQVTNYIAVNAVTNTGTYTVDWGDGTSTSHTSNTVAYKTYTWSSISSATLTSRGYRQAIVTITPTTAGAFFTSILLNPKHTSVTSNTNNFSNPWLDIAIAAPNANTITFSYNTTGTKTTTMNYCEQIKIVSQNLLSCTYLFRDLRNLYSVSISGSSATTLMQYMFSSCTSLQTVSLFNTASVTSMTSMFSNCTSLKTVSLFNTASVNNMYQMFYLCYSLQTVPIWNTASVTNMDGMFYGCYSLQTVPLFNTVSVTNMSNMFYNCMTLQTVPLFNTALVTNMTNMFYGCNSLKTVPLFNTALVTNMSSMFRECHKINNLPLFNTASVTIMDAMFYLCYSLQTVPIWNTASVTNMGTMFNNNFSLSSIPELSTSSISVSGLNPTIGGGSSSAASNLGKVKLTGNRWTANFTNCALGGTEIDEMYTALAILNPSVTNVTASGTVVTYTIDDRRAFVAGRTVTMTGISPVAYNLIAATVGTVTAGAGNTGTFTVTNAATGDFVSGGVATLTDNKTITVTGNPGTATDTPSIATNKGWTVVG
jgi:surface protein